MPAKPTDKGKARRPEHVALVLQGGGALGAYQAGVYEQLAAAGIAPDWVAGISIGALNAAIIAGNAPAERVAALRTFWSTISEPQGLATGHLPPANTLTGLADFTRPWVETLGAWRAVAEGQRGFFRPRNWLLDNPLLDGAPDEASYYDTAPMLETLAELADFERINRGDVHVSVGAVDVETSELVYFDNRCMTLEPRHFLASGALPPGFPPVEIDGRWYWDGGLVSNTPLAHVLNAESPCDMLVFQVDLWNADGAAPTTLLEVMEREKEIRYASRTRWVTRREGRERHIRRLLREILEQVPAKRRAADPWCRYAEKLAVDARTCVVQLAYRDGAAVGHFKDFHFGQAAMREHWRAGMSDATRALAEPGWLDMPSGEQTFVSHELPPAGRAPG